jgi:hypothetical protein
MNDMLWELAESANSSRILRLAALAALVSFAACSGCEACGGEPSAPDVGATNSAAPDTGAEAEPDAAEDLTEAREAAVGTGLSTGVHVSDIARAVGGEIEAQGAAPPKVRPNLKNKAEPETGQLAKAKLNKVFNVHAGAMKKCYERSLKKSPGLQGKVRLEIVISSRGKVTSANVRGMSLRDRSIEGCMERQALTMQFPEPDGGAVRVNKTYSFFPEF